VPDQSQALIDEIIDTEALIVGAGPCGLFQVFELGLLGIRADVVDSLSAPGGQCTELYPDKPIYDIPALPVCGAKELVDRLLLQIRPFGAQMHLGQEVCELARGENGRFVVRTTKGTRFSAGAIVIAAGVGSFQFRKLGLAGCEGFEGVHIHYRVSKASDFANRRVIVFGGGDSALDWTIELANIASSVTLVHRRAEFRAAMASVTKMRALAADGRIAYLEGIAQQLHELNGSLQGITVRCSDGREQLVDADSALVFFGLHPKLGPIAEWGLELERKALRVDTERFQTNIPGIFAVGDINTYPGKKKLILSGFHEAALAAFGIQHYLYPEKRQHVQYTTTSPIMQKRLGMQG
jgi:thioredoxin reductase (NADPH)